MSPMTEPNIDDIKMVRSTFLQPRKAPIIAKNLRSPPPIASFLKTTEPMRRIINKEKNPNNAPEREAKNVALWDESPRNGGYIPFNIRPNAIPG